MNELNHTNQDNASTAKLIYILYLASLLFGITALVGLVMAYVYRADAPDWLRTHYQWQIRTFWIGMLYGIIGGLLLLVLIGYPILIFVIVWWIIRCVKGLRAVESQQACSDPKSWLF